MTLIEDTRNKVGKHKNIAAYCQRCGIELVREKLDYGDYMFPGGHISIDTKQNLEEVASNLLNRSHRDSIRFWNEVRNAHKNGIKLVILVEHGGEIKSINDVPKWRSRFSGVTGRRLIDEMIRTEMAYSVRWVFTDRRSTARKIIEILKEEQPIENENHA